MILKFIQRLFFLSLVVSSVCIYPFAHGSTIAQIGTDELINRSELIFEGTVVAVETELNQYGRVYTYVDFVIEDVLAGSTDSSTTLTLRFTGGNAEGVEMDLGVRIPQLNERGIYFVEKVAHGLINPLLGWEQGHFVVNDSGVVIAANSLVVETVELRSRSDNTNISDGVALGINTRLLKENDSEDLDDQFFRPMLVTDFKDRIRELRN